MADTEPNDEGGGLDTAAVAREVHRTWSVQSALVPLYSVLLALAVASVIILLVGAFAASPRARETVKFITETDQGCLPIGSPQEIVVKIDLTAAPDAKVKRAPLNLAVVIDRSGSMAGAKIEKAR